MDGCLLAGSGGAQDEKKKNTVGFVVMQSCNLEEKERKQSRTNVRGPLADVQEVRIGYAVSE